MASRRTPASSGPSMPWSTAERPRAPASSGPSVPWPGAERPAKVEGHVGRW
ncbi:hypothetical protein WMF39_12810 [Sorangium sp. So ce1504]|uniref:hypothetical protein n=1 Tax=Sorangium sp. So ce1504 TaxID=3133337 RepID=UPI003F620783